MNRQELAILAFFAAVLLALPFASAKADSVKWAYQGCTVGVASAQCFASVTGPHYMRLQNKSATANVACIWAGAGATASLTDNVSFKMAPGALIVYDHASMNLPAGPLACISDTAATPLYVEGY